MKRVALVGGRGYTGSELLALLAGHGSLELAWASSSSQAGQPIQASCPQWPDPQACFVEVTPDTVDRHHADAWVLALPNGVAGQWARAIASAHPAAVVLDLSADHRFDTGWVYGLPEINRAAIRGATRIANPGCYATAAMLGLWPLRERLVDVPTLFGVSGYSGAGRTPSPRNDPELLHDNLMPYALSGHVHEREVSHQLGCEVRFMPHVASFFRGISMTVAATLDREIGVSELQSLYHAAYLEEPRVHVDDGIPQVRQVAGRPDALLGGFTVDPRDPRRVTLVCVLDNLAKGAASQALQNLNLALGLDEHEGVGP